MDIDDTSVNEQNESALAAASYESVQPDPQQTVERACQLLAGEPAAASETRPVIYRAAGFWIRLLAFGIDLGVIACLNAILLRTVLPGNASQWSLFYLIETNALFLGITGLAYFILMTYYFSQTLGKMITGIQVVQHSGLQLTWETVIFRELVGRTLSQLMGLNLGYVVCWFHHEKRCLHDLIGDTWVVHVKTEAHPGCIALERPLG